MTAADHGTYARYQTHRRRNEEPCDACRAANRAYLAGWRARNPRNTSRHAETNYARDRAYRALAKLHPAEFEALYSAELRALAGSQP